MHPAPEHVMVDLLISEVYTIGPCFSREELILELQLELTHYGQN